MLLHPNKYKGNESWGIRFDRLLFGISRKDEEALRGNLELQKRFSQTVSLGRRVACFSIVLIGIQQEIATSLTREDIITFATMTGILSYSLAQIDIMRTESTRETPEQILKMLRPGSAAWTAKLQNPSE